MFTTILSGYILDKYSSVPTHCFWAKYFFICQTLVIHALFNGHCVCICVAVEFLKFYKINFIIDLYWQVLVLLRCVYMLNNDICFCLQTHYNKSFMNMLDQWYDICNYFVDRWFLNVKIWNLSFYVYWWNINVFSKLLMIG